MERLDREVLVLVGHGAGEEARLLYEQLAREVRSGYEDTRLVMLHGEPSAARTAEELAGEGVRRVQILPLLLALLGGLFVVGELAMGRLVSQEMDRALAWRAADRFGPTDFDADAFSHVVGAHGLRHVQALPMPAGAAHRDKGAGGLDRVRLS